VEIAASTIDSTEEILGIKLDGARDILYAETTEQRWAAATSWFGSFSTGSKNSKMERKGSRGL